MIVALTLGLTGSLGHCIGMCSAVILLLKRHPSLRDSHTGWALAHAGRLTTYTILGALVGFAGHLVGIQLGTIKNIQGLVAFLMAALAIYFGLAILGRMPSPDLAMGGIMGKWSQAMRVATAAEQEPDSSNWWTPYSLGLLWGLLPCGLVLTALFTAAVSTSFQTGAARMFVFGLGTLPALLGVRWFSDRQWKATWPRYAAASLMMVFGTQFIFRGLASWGVVNHLMVRGVMLW